MNKNIIHNKAVEAKVADVNLISSPVALVLSGKGKEEGRGKRKKDL